MTNRKDRQNKENEQIVNFLINKWKKDLVREKEEWDKDPGWPAKLVKTKFKLSGVEFTVLPKDLGLSDDGWDQGLMEHFQGKMKKDLEQYGATDIYNFGFMD